MTINRFARTFVFAAMTVIILIACTACGSSPNGPSPIATCQDKLANNYGQPGSCTYTTPAQSFLQIENVIPSTQGVTLKRFQDSVSVMVGYGLSQADQDYGKANGLTPVVKVCVSADGVTGGSNCFVASATAPVGTTSNGVTEVDIPGQPNQTTSIIAYFEWKTPTAFTPFGNMLVYPWVINWVEP